MEELSEEDRNTAISNLKTIVDYLSVISPALLEFLDDSNNISQMKLEYEKLKRRKNYEPITFPAFAIARYIGILETLNEKYQKLSS